MKPFGIVYRVTNTVNGKTYIGITTRSLSIRKSGHYNRANNGSKNKFHRALLKHREDCFVWETICSCNDLLELEEKEKYYISLFKEDELYNITEGGRVGALGYKHTDEERKRRSDKLKTAGGIRRSDKLNKPIVCINNNDVFASISDAGRFFDISDKNIGKLLKRGYGTLRGLMFRYATEKEWANIDKEKTQYNEQELKEMKKANSLKPNGRRVKCLEDERIFKSASEAARFYKIRAGGITRVCRGERNKYSNMRFVYVDN
jgi:group I intron endonuclease